MSLPILFFSRSWKLILKANLLLVYLRLVQIKINVFLRSTLDENFGHLLKLYNFRLAVIARMRVFIILDH